MSVINKKRKKELFERDERLYDKLPRFMKSGQHLAITYPLAHFNVRLNEMNALKWLKKHAEDDLSVKLILGLNRALTRGTAYEGSGFKTVQNNVGGDQGTTFYVTASPEETPKAVEELCERFSYLNKGDPADFEDVFLFTLDFICIHPMDDGNGRLSVMLSQFLLHKMGLKCAYLVPFDFVQKSECKDLITRAIRRASGLFYGQKPYEADEYITLMMNMLCEAYDHLEEAAAKH